MYAWVTVLGMMQGEEGRDRRQIRKMQCVRPSTALTTALGLLLETGVSSLPVTDEVLSCSALYFCGTYSVALLCTTTAADTLPDKIKLPACH